MYERRRMCLTGDAGQAFVLVALLVGALAVGAMVLIAEVGGTVNDRQRARTAADAAALAGVTGGRPAADEVAGRNGGSLEAFVVDGTEVEAQVRVGRARASARAAPGAPKSAGSESMQDGSMRAGRARPRDGPATDRP